jgi:hypothetical protein
LILTSRVSFGVSSRAPFRHADGNSALGVAFFGRIDEWYLVSANSFQEITLGFPPWLSEVAIVIRVAFFEPRFIPIRTICHSVTSHRVEQVFVKDPAAGRVVFALEGNHRLERF